MNGFQNRKGQDLQKPFPGCMGRMINIFDLSTGMMGTKLLTEKAHRDGSPIHRNRPDVAKKKAIDTVGVQIEDKLTASDLRKSSSKESGGTPMKMLIARERLRETESSRKPPNVVARLMGLDALPVQQSVLNAQRSLQEGYSHNSSAGEFRGYRQQEDGSYHNQSQWGTRLCAHEKEYKDVYEIWQQPSRTIRFKNQPPQKGRYSESPTEKRMALVRQKFMEAKRLATDEKLLQSKEFQDALEVLSSNRDLFLKFLDEPSSLFSKHLHELQTIPPLSQTKHITVLKPSKTVEAKSERQMKKHLHPAVEVIDCDTNRHQRSSSITHPMAENISQPTRIVVLKPSPGKHHEMKTMVASPIPSSKLLDSREFYAGLGTDEAIESREIAKEITRKMQEYLSSHRRDETLLSSALSNGYIGDESSINRSENDYIEEECGNASDSETVTPTSQNSWDYINRFDSPYSISSFSRASYSPESSVIREAKKRLLERWAMVASNGIGQEQTQVRKSSSTLGEMLAIPEVKKEEGSDSLIISSRRSCGGDQDLRLLAACSSISGTKEGCSGEECPRNLSRSKSVPVSSSVYENIGLNEEVSDSLISKSIVPKEAAKSKSRKSSFKGKISSLFFSGIKKTGRDKPNPSPSVGSDYRFHSSSAETFGKRNDALSKSSHDGQFEESTLVNFAEKSGKASTPTLNNGPKQSTSSGKASLSLEKPRTSENSRENQDQPSPISVLEAPFKDDANDNISQPSACTIAGVAGHPQALSRSPPIESVARTLTWDGTRLDISQPKSLKLSRILSKECEEQLRFAFVQKLLSSAGLDNEESSTVLARWHSLDSPLDPMLLDEFLDMKEEEAECRERRSNQRLLFDCVNAALLDIGRTTLMGGYPWARAYGGALKDARDCALVAEEVWRLLRDWIPSEGKQISGETENQKLVVEGVVKREVAGREWAEWMWLEIEEFSKEIGGEVLEDLVEEALADLTDGCVC